MNRYNEEGNEFVAKELDAFKTHGENEGPLGYFYIQFKDYIKKYEKVNNKLRTECRELHE